MADGKVLLEVVVEGKNVKVVQRQVEGVTSAVNENTAAQNRNAKATNAAASANDHFGRGLKGVAGVAPTGTKNFSKMRDAMNGSSGLVGAYATLAANLFAATAAFEALRKAAQVDRIRQSIESIGTATGQNILGTSKAIQQMTDFALSSGQAMQAASLGFSAGFDSTQLTQLAKVAKGASAALGRDLSDSYDRLIRGAAKLEPEILDELGIIVRIKDATESYARSVGKTVEELTTYERQQAFINEINEQGTRKFGMLADSLEASPYDKFAAALDNATKALIKFLAETAKLPELFEYLSNNTFALGGAITLFASTISRQMLPVLYEGPARAAEVATLASKEAINAAEKAKTAGQSLGQGLSKLPGVYSKLLPAFQAGTASAEEQAKGITSLNRSISSYQSKLKKFEEGNLNLSPEKVTEYKDRIIELSEEVAKAKEIFSGSAKTQQAAIDATNRANRKLAESNVLVAASSFDLKGTWVALKAVLVAYRAQATAAISTNSALAASFKLVSLAASGLAFAARFAITVFLNFLPVIGALATFGPMLKDWFMNKFFPESEAEKKKKIIDGMQSKIQDFFSRLVDTNTTFNIDFQTDGLDRTTRALGIFVNTLGDLIDTLSAAESEAKKKALEINLQRPGGANDILQDLQDSQKTLSELRREQFQLKEEIANPIVALESASSSAIASANTQPRDPRTELAGVEKRLKEQQEKVDRLSSSYKMAYQNAILLAEADIEPESLVYATIAVEQYRDEIRGTLATLGQGIQDDINSRFESLLQKTSSKEIFKGLRVLKTDFGSLESSIRGTGEAFSGVTDSLIQLGKAEETTYSPVIKKINELLKARQVEQRKAASNDKIASAAAKDRLKILDATLEAEAKAAGFSGIGQLEALLPQLQNADRIERTLNAAKSRFEELNKLAAPFTEYEEVQLFLLKERVDLKNQEIEAEKTRLTVMKQSGQADPAAIAAQKSKIALLESEKRIIEKNTEGRELALETAKKILSVEKATSEALITAQKNRLIIESPTGELTTRQEDQLVREQFETRKRYLEQERDLKIEQIDLEYELLEIKFELLREEAKLDGKLTQGLNLALDKVKSRLSKYPEAARKQAEAEFQAGLTGLQVELQKATVDLASKVNVSVGGVMKNISEIFYDDIKNTVALSTQLAQSFANTLDSTIDAFVNAIVEGKNVFTAIKNAFRDTLREGLAEAAKSQLKLGIKVLMDDMGFNLFVDPATKAAEGAATAAQQVATSAQDISSALQNMCSCGPTTAGPSLNEDPVAKNLKTNAKLSGEISQSTNEGAQAAQKGNWLQQKWGEAQTYATENVGTIAAAGFASIVTAIAAGRSTKSSIIGGILGIAGTVVGGMFGGGAAGAVFGGQVGAMVGARAFASGGVMSASGPVPLEKYARGGIARTPQLAMFGEGSRPEAYVPLPDGRTIPVTMSNSGGNVNNISVNVAVEGGQAQAQTAGGADNTEEYSRRLGTAISNAVKQEIFNQQRPGGLLYKGRR